MFLIGVDSYKIQAISIWYNDRTRSALYNCDVIQCCNNFFFIRSEPVVFNWSEGHTGENKGTVVLNQIFNKT